MREIVFRGKCIDNGEWIFGVPIFDWYSGGKTANIINVGLIECCSDNMVIPETVGQFTGLLDKNGKHVFEGDKIKLTQGIGTVEWSKTQSRFMIWLPKSNKFASFLAGIEYEVIGNIHDNQELLT